MKIDKPSQTIGVYAAAAKGKVLKRDVRRPPKLGPGDVRVSVTHCGVCHTDISAIDDYYRITEYPFVPGHEIVGHVSEKGRAVAGLKEGDRVGIGWQGRSCGKCRWCKTGHVNLCYDIVNGASWLPNGGFSDSVIADSRFAYPIPKAMRSENAAVLLCAGITVYSPLRAYLTGTSRKVGVVGVGGLGHLAIQFCRVLGCEVTAISSSPDKKNEALGFGADHFMDANDRGALDKAEFSLDLLLVASSAGVPWGPVVNVLEKKGRLVLLGFPMISLHPRDVVAHEVSITGSFIGNHAAMKEMLRFAQDSGIKPMIELMPMTQVNKAIQRVRENKARYRIVLVNG